MKLGTTIFTALVICISANAEGTRKLGKKGEGNCDLTGMYDMIETPTYYELGVAATDTAKLSLICFDDEEDFEDWGCLMQPGECGRRNLKETFKNTKSLGEGRSLYYYEDFDQICYFEYLGFPDLSGRRGLKEEEATALDADRKLQPGIHNVGVALVFKEDVPFPNGKDKKLCAAYSDGYNDWGLGAFALQIRDGVLAIQTDVETEFPYFAFKTTK